MPPRREAGAMATIVETDLRFGRLRPMKTVRRIVIHHTKSGDVSAAEVHRWHLGRKKAGNGYHYHIRQSGRIERGRPEDKQGAHARGSNADSIGVALAGHFGITPPTDAQIESLVWLTLDIRRRHGAKVPVVRHRDVSATLCPERLFPWTEFLAMLAPRTYRVRSGDTLWEIAVAHLGNGERWPEIQRLNRLAGTTIRPGQVLRLPRR